MTVSTCVGPQSGMIYNLRNNLLHKNREKSKVLNNLLLNVKNYFRDLNTSSIKGVIIVGISNDFTFERMLRDPNLNPEEPMQLRQSSEQNEIQMKKLKQYAWL